MHYILEEFEVTTINQYGLDSSQVRDLTARGKVNVQVDRTAKTTKDIIKENVFTYFNLIFLIISLLLIVAGIVLHIRGIKRESNY